MNKLNVAVKALEQVAAYSDAVHNAPRIAREALVVIAAQASPVAQDADAAFEIHRIEQTKILGMSGLAARPCFTAGFQAGRASVAVPVMTVEVAPLCVGVPFGWRDAIEHIRDHICAGGLAENAQHERSVVEPYLDLVVDALAEFEELQPAAQLVGALTGSQRGMIMRCLGGGSEMGWISDSDQSSITKAISAAQPVGEAANINEVPHLIFFDDRERAPELLIGRERALIRYKQISESWNAHLFVKIDSNSRNCRYPSAAPSAQPVAQDQDGAHDATLELVARTIRDWAYPSDEMFVSSAMDAIASLKSSAAHPPVDDKSGKSKGCA